ncbi:Cobalt/magnesium transport protein CorA [uncultured archaeon]|nr:Cobalt/magnesium transport protein CorA [uncultured archaeon]
MRESSENQSCATRLCTAVYRVFNDDMMIALAAILACSVIFQMLFEFSPGMLVIFEYLNYLIIAAFAAEYILKLYVAKSRASFVSNPLHILDLFIILLALFDITFIGYISIIPNQAQLSPVLRLLRLLPRLLPRVLLTFFLAGRTAKRIENPDVIENPSKPVLQISTFEPMGNPKRCDAKDAGCSIMLNAEPIWIDFQYVAENDLEFIERTTNISRDMLETKLILASFPRIDPAEGVPTIFLWDSQIKLNDSSTDAIDIATNNILVVCNGQKIITLSREKSDLFDKISSELANKGSRDHFKGEEFTVKILYSLLRRKMLDYSDIVQKIEQKTIGFEEIPVDRTSPKFLEETFHFKKEIQKVYSNLWHFHQVLHQLIDPKNLSLLKINDSTDFNNLHEESDYLLETAKNIRESLISLIELHINTVSYDMNRVMKVIAVITCLAIIPSVVGGLLGVNIAEADFPIKLGELIFLVFSFMLLGLYAFYKMDWLK